MDVEEYWNRIAETDIDLSMLATVLDEGFENTMLRWKQQFVALHQLGKASKKLQERITGMERNLRAPFLRVCAVDLVDEIQNEWNAPIVNAVEFSRAAQRFDLKRICPFLKRKEDRAIRNLCIEVVYQAMSACYQTKEIPMTWIRECRKRLFISAASDSDTTPPSSEYHLRN